jgi:hypothetical protein
MKVTLLRPLDRVNVWTLENPTVRVSIERDTGLIRSAVFKKNKVDLFQQVRSCVAGHAGGLRVYDERDDVWYEDLRSEFRITDGRQRGNAVTFTKHYPKTPHAMFRVRRSGFVVHRSAFFVENQRHSRRARDRLLQHRCMKRSRGKLRSSLPHEENDIGLQARDQGRT